MKVILNLHDVNRFGKGIPTGKEEGSKNEGEIGSNSDPEILDAR